MICSSYRQHTRELRTASELTGPELHWGFRLHAAKELGDLVWGCEVYYQGGSWMMWGWGWGWGWVLEGIGRASEGGMMWLRCCGWRLLHKRESVSVV